MTASNFSASGLLKSIPSEDPHRFLSCKDYSDLIVALEGLPITIAGIISNHKKSLDEMLINYERQLTAQAASNSIQPVPDQNDEETSALVELRTELQKLSVKKAELTSAIEEQEKRIRVYLRKLRRYRTEGQILKADVSRSTVDIDFLNMRLSQNTHTRRSKRKGNKRNRGCLARMTEQSDQMRYLSNLDSKIHFCEKQIASITSELVSPLLA
jgi:chromosome segregation ATPase